MRMIDIYAPAGIFPGVHRLASDAAAAVMAIEQAPDIPMFRQNVGAFVHEMPTEAISPSLLSAALQGQETRTRVFPKLCPSSMPMNACGAASKPSTTCSR